jgi:DNA-binding winged helix-turn-helix (wHTH) protein
LADPQVFPTVFRARSMRLAFGSCVLDTDTREVLREGAPVHLTPLAFHLLERLVAHRPKALSKAELQDALWPGTFVTEASLSSLVADLRAAIGDEARGSTLIRTVHRHGYAFAGEVRVLSGGATRDAGRSYRLFWYERELVLDEGETILGRSRDATLFIDDEGVSRRRARIAISGDDVLVEDLGSKNGTMVNGERVTGPTRIQDAATIRIGSVTLTFRMFTELGPTKTEG